MKATQKNTLREIAKSKGRFLSILLISAIGVGFFSGVRASSLDMRVSADKYYDANKLFDLRVVSTFGLTENDLSSIRSLDNEFEAYPSKYTDLAAYRNEDEYLTRVFSKQTAPINTIDIFEGRDIENPAECLLSTNMLKKPINLGEKLNLEDLTNAEDFPLKYKEYTVVGIYNTPMYISITQRGSTNIGDGAIDAFMIVPEEDFTQEVYTEIYVRSDKMREAESYSDEYKSRRDEFSDRLEALGKDRSVIRYDEVIGDALKEIEDGEKKLADAKRDGQKELDDAKNELEKAKQEIADGEKELEKAEKELEDGKKALAEGEKKLSDGKAEIDSGRIQIELGKPFLENAKSELDKAQAEFDKNKSELEAGKTKLQEAKDQYSAGLSEYEQNALALSEQEKQLSLAEQMYGKPAMASQRAQLEAAKSQLSAAKAALDAAYEEITKNDAELSAGEAQLKEAEKQLKKGWDDYNENLKKYNDGLASLAEGEKAYEEGQKKLAEMKAEYEKGLADLEQGKIDLEDAKKQYAEGLVEYEDGVETYNREIADAEKELADAREKVSDAGKAEWYVFTREDNTGYAEYESNSERIGKIAAIFPVFFLLVAGLVCLTTMSRMVEEQRTQIGTLKALGYANGAIMRHYMTYAVSGAVIGGTLGAFGGCLLFPWVIMYAYSIMYNITDFTFLFTPDNIILSVGSMTLAIALTVFFSCKKALEETPASLMRPKAPKAGKRVFLERVTFLWNRMNFFAKVSGRNIFRYKRRMFMTVIGIAGCTALSLTGFGLKDSISDIVDLQYLDIYKYSGFLAYDDEAKPSDLNSIYEDLKSYNPDTEYMRALVKQYETRFDKNTLQCYVTCVEKASELNDFIDLRERVSREKLSLTDGAVISEKAAKLLNAKQGDEITLQISDGVYRTVKISAITEHYTSHYLYLSEELYKEVFGASPKYNMIYFNNGISEEGKNADIFSEKMLKNDSVLAVMINATSMSTIHETLSIMDMVTIVLIVSAGALAFVVLYNLSNVNITERIREIATLKVLGFYDAEVSSYIFRENIVLSIMGGAVGLALGSALCMFVITTAEIDEVMFGRVIHPLSFLWAFLVTIGFSLIVNLIMTRVLKKVSMVESLKSIE